MRTNVTIVIVSTKPCVIEYPLQAVLILLCEPRQPALSPAIDPAVRALAVGAPRNLALSIGVVVSETTSETMIAADRRYRKLAEQPAHDAAHQQDRDEDRDQRGAHRHDSEADLLEPSIAAWKGDFPLSRWREMFSMTTIASSTTNPVEIVRAIRLRLSSV